MNNKRYYATTDGQPPKKAGFASSEPFSIDTLLPVTAGGSAVDGVVRAVASATERSHSAAAAFGAALLRGGEDNVGQFLYLEGMEYNIKENISIISIVS